MAAVSGGLSPKQSAFMRTSNTRVCLLEGSIRSGKTIVSLLRWLMFVNTAPKGGELVMVGRTRDALYRNIIAPLQNEELFGPLAELTVANNGAPTVMIMGRKVHAIGASDAKAEKILRGMTVAGAYVDEATVLPKEFFTQLLGRMSVRGAQLFATTNPDSPAHWLMTDYLAKIDTLPGWRRFHFDLDDNPSLTASYKASIKAEFTPGSLFYRRFIEGEWVAAEGAVWPMWDPKRHVAPAAELLGYKPLHVGVDYGAVHPSRAYATGLVPDPRGGERLAIVAEWAPKVGLTSAQQASDLKTWIERLPAPPTWIAVDHAAQGFIADVRLVGVRRVMNAHKSVLSGIEIIGSLLGADRLVVSDACPELIKQISGYAWDAAAEKRGETKPLKKDDDAVDAMRYGVFTGRTAWRRAIPLATPDRDDNDTDDDD